LIDGLGWTQCDLAKACGCAQSTISSIYAGKTKQPGADIGMKLLELQAAGTRVEAG
jgi:transcriptional regulator with XRE-family HTH domain